MLHNLFQKKTTHFLLHHGFKFRIAYINIISVIFTLSGVEMLLQVLCHVVILGSENSQAYMCPSKVNFGVDRETLFG